MNSDVDAIVRVLILLVNSPDMFVEDKTLVDLAYLLGEAATKQKEKANE